jgi:hypothetical protein
LLNRGGRWEHLKLGSPVSIRHVPCCIDDIFPCRPSFPSAERSGAGLTLWITSWAPLLNRSCHHFSHHSSFNSESSHLTIVPERSHGGSAVCGDVPTVVGQRLPRVSGSLITRHFLEPRAHLQSRTDSQMTGRWITLRFRRYHSVRAWHLLRLFRPQELHSPQGLQQLGRSARADHHRPPTPAWLVMTTSRMYLNSSELRGRPIGPNDLILLLENGLLP